MMVIIIPIEVTAFSKVIAQCNDVHKEQHPDPPGDEHITLMGGCIEGLDVGCDDG